MVLNSILLQAAEVATIDYTTIILAVVGIISGGALTKIYEVYSKNRKEDREQDSADSNEFKQNLQERVLDLESKVDHLNERIEAMITMYTDKILLLSTDKVRLEEEVKNLKEDIVKLRVKVKALKDN